MRQVRLDDTWDIPTVKVLLGGRRQKRTKAMVVFDTGSAMTQIDIDLAETMGYSAREAVEVLRVKGATGEAVEGFVFHMSNLLVFGNEFRDIAILTYDFKNFPGIDGLLGWDLIKRLHLEMDGPSGVLKVF